MRRGRAGRSPEGRCRRPNGPAPLTEAEVAAVAALFAPELRRGWIPRERDLRAGVEAVARRHGGPSGCVE